MENKSINIKVGGRFYPLSIPSEEEEILRDLEKKAAKIGRASCRERV